MKTSNLLIALIWFVISSFCSFGCGRTLKESVSNSEPKEYSQVVLTIVEISNPKQPKMISSISLPWELNDSNCATVWKQFLIMTSSYGVHLLNVENPEKPRLLWNLPLAISIRKVVVFEDYAFFPTEKGLYVLQLRNPIQPQWVFRAENKPHLNVPLLDLKIKERYAYTLDGYRYLHVLDLSEPAMPKLVTSHPVSGSSVLFFRVFDEKVQPILQQPEISSLINQVHFFHMNHDFPADFWAQLSERSNLLVINPSDRVVKVNVSNRYLCLFSPLSTTYQLWLISPENKRIYPLDIALEFTKHLYTSGKKKISQKGNITDIRVFGDQIVFISQDNWTQTVKVEREEWGGITDLQLSDNLAYITFESGVLFMAKLSAESLEGFAMIENLPPQSQILTLNQNYLYLLGRESSP